MGGDGNAKAKAGIEAVVEALGESIKRGRGRPSSHWLGLDLGKDFKRAWIIDGLQRQVRQYIRKNGGEPISARQWIQILMADGSLPSLFPKVGDLDALCNSVSRGRKTIAKLRRGAELGRAFESFDRASPPIKKA